MIGKLTGFVDTVLDTTLILDVGGVGYEISCSSSLSVRLKPLAGKQDHTLSLWIDTIMRENEVRLIGFESLFERQWFRLLITVQGVGARVALAILGMMSPQELADAITFDDKSAITRAPGVGKKVAERIINELKNKTGSVSFSDSSSTAASGTLSPAPSESAPNTPTSSPFHDALSALCNLGYQRDQALRALKQVSQDKEEITTSELIRLALKQLSTM
jgi:Holliday junction DNA helicase RuvA